MYKCESVWKAIHYTLYPHTPLASEQHEACQLHGTLKTVTISGHIFARIARMPKQSKNMVKISPHTNSSFPIITGNFDSVDDTFNTWEYLLSQSWIDNYPYSNSKSLIDVGLFMASVPACQGLSKIVLENQIMKHEDIKDDYHLLWIIFSTFARVLI